MIHPYSPTPTRFAALCASAASDQSRTSTADPSSGSSGAQALDDSYIAAPFKAGLDRSLEGLGTILDTSHDSSRRQQLRGFARELQASMGDFDFWTGAEDAALGFLVNSRAVTTGLSPETMSVHDLVEHGLFGRATTAAADRLPALLLQDLDEPRADTVAEFFRRATEVGSPSGESPFKTRATLLQNIQGSLEGNMKGQFVAYFADDLLADSQLIIAHIEDGDLEKALKCSPESPKKESPLRWNSSLGTMDYRDESGREQLYEQISEKVKVSALAENVYTLEREVAMAPWALDCVRALGHGQPMPVIPEDVQNRLAKLHENKEHRPTCYEYNSSQMEDLRIRGREAKGSVYRAADKMLQTMEALSKAELSEGGITDQDVSHYKNENAKFPFLYHYLQAWRWDWKGEHGPGLTPGDPNLIR